jgi:hypothetical protein
LVQRQWPISSYLISWEETLLIGRRLAQPVEQFARLRGHPA